ncbi:hypothetical protein SAJA_03620 [Salinisphaera japonica YTM-1]|uniref:Uncharacterized protein n=1 Tax=Salinisphaera japonica YTM-1 TaxID=1209778 RepID=A0A423PZS0_9GAMM|nr:hypothetical protein SAJA_03620 [Salinisphaera japonica YTM-1]
MVGSIRLKQKMMHATYRRDMHWMRPDALFFKTGVIGVAVVSWHPLALISGRARADTGR